MDSKLRLEAMIGRAYALAAGALDNQIDPALAEEVSGECAELLALINDDKGAFPDPECIDTELVTIAEKINKHF
jgi:hypothetical protein